MARSNNCKPSHTLLVITRTQIARVDFVGKRRPKVNQVWSSPSTNIESPIDSAIRAIKLGPNRVGELTIVSPNFWTEIMRLPADVVAIATPTELRHALALEAEKESGIVGFDSQIGYQQVLDDDSVGVHFLTTQIEKSVVASFTQFASTNRSKLRSLAHPIALQLHQHTTVQSVTDQLNWWHSEPVDFFPDLENLAERAIALLVLPRDRAPALISPKSTYSKSKQLALTAVLMFLSTGSCFAWNLSTHNRLHATTSAIRRAEKKQQQSAQTAAELKRRESKLVNLTKEAQEANNNRTFLEKQLRAATERQGHQNARWSLLIDALADVANDCWIQQIEADVHQTTIHGLSLSNAEAHSFAARLEQELKDAGWILSPAATKLTESSLYQFSITIRQAEKVPIPTDGLNEIVSLTPNSASVNLNVESITERLP